MFKVEIKNGRVLVMTGFHSKEAYEVLADMFWDKLEPIKSTFKYSPVSKSWVHFDSQRNELYFEFWGRASGEAVVSHTFYKILNNLKNFFNMKKAKLTTFEKKCLKLIEDMKSPRKQNDKVLPDDPFIKARIDILNRELDRLVSEQILDQFDDFDIICKKLEEAWLQCLS